MPSLVGYAFGPMVRRCRYKSVVSLLVALFLSVPCETDAQDRYSYVDLPGTQPGGLNDGAPLDSARACGTTCHFSLDASRQSAMPYDGWVGSMMGNTLRDPLFLAALTVAEQDHPGVGDYCLRCHTPPGFVNGRTRGSAAAHRGAALDSTDRDGVTCDSCHRMVRTDNLGNAQYVFSTDETRFGPYEVIHSIRHPGARSDWLSDPRMCATCHEITNPAQPLLRPDGTDTGQRFPLDTTYSEWLHSDFARSGSPDARTCQDCHMPRMEGRAFVSTDPGAMERDRPRRHDFAGANAWMLRVLGSLRADTNSGDFYDPDLVPFYEAGARRAEAMLRNALALELREVPTRLQPGARGEVLVRVTNRAGHRVPTGYADGRRVWLTVELIDTDGQVTTISGAYDNTEAHLDEHDPQLRVYEAIHGRADIGREEHIALHNTVLRDTRLPPRGYRPPPGHEPVGVDYSGGPDGALRHWDDVRYVFTVPQNARGTLTLRVRARYQSTTREYVEFLARENRTDDRGRELLRLYEASGRAAPIDMAEVSAPIEIDTAPDGGVTDGGDAGRMDEAPAPRGSCACHAAGHGRAARTSLFALLFGMLSFTFVRRRKATHRTDF